MGFRKMIRESRTSSCARNAGFRIDDDGVWLHEILGEQRGQLQNGCSRVTAGRCNQPCLGDRGAMQFWESVDGVLQQACVGMRGVIPLFIDRWILESIIGAEVHHQFAGFGGRRRPAPMIWCGEAPRRPRQSAPPRLRVRALETRETQGLQDWERPLPREFPRISPMSRRGGQNTGGGLPGERAPLRRIRWPLQLRRVFSSSASPDMHSPTQKRKAWSLPSSDCGSDVYRFEYWNRFLAPFCPYFFRSLTRESRVSKPSFFKGVRRGWLSLHQRARDCMTQGAGLAGRSAAVYGGLDRVLPNDTADFERELNNLPQGQPVGRLSRSVAR